MPFRTMWKRSEVSQCGWAFASVTRPCVAQRVWPMPVEPFRWPFERATALRRFWRLPTAWTLPIEPSATSESPAES